MIPTVVSRLEAGSSRASSPLPSSDSTDPSGSRPSSRNPVLPVLTAGNPGALIGGVFDSNSCGGGATSASSSGLQFTSGSDKTSSSNHHSTKNSPSVSATAAGSSASSSNQNFNPFAGMSNPAIVAAASQAISATSNMQQGRRTSSLKASYEALKNAGELAKELTFGGSVAGGEVGSGVGSGSNAYGSNAFVTEAPSTSSLSTKHKHKKVRPNNSALHPSSSTHLSSGEGSSVSLGNLQFGSSLNSATTVGVAGTCNSQQTGCQDGFGIDDYFGGGGGGLSGLDDSGGAAGGGLVDAGGEGSEFQVDGGDWAYDPNEPRYCICNQVSYGEMVGCDNGDCPIEWFHYGCVGLTQAPKGKWFCPQCTATMKRRNRR